MNKRKRNRLRTIYYNMTKRCLDPQNPSYQMYGGRGITICDEWLNNYAEFEVWAKSNGYNDSLSLDRENNDKGYEPSNCRWVSSKEQANNRRNNRISEYKGFTGSISQICEHFNLNYGLVNNRIQKGWSEYEAFSIPLNGRKENRCKMITFDDVTLSVSEWAKKVGIKHKTLCERLRMGWDIEKALTEPIKRRNNNGSK